MTLRKIRNDEIKWKAFRCGVESSHVNLPGKGRRIKDAREERERWETALPPLWIGKRGRSGSKKGGGGGDRGKGGRKKKKEKKKKNRKSVGKRNYRLMRRSFHHVASEREDAIDRCFTTEVIRVFARPLFPKTRSFRHDTPGLESSSVGNCSAETPATDVVEIR